MSTKTPIAGSLIARAIGTIRDAATAWFGPRNPLPPVAPPEVAGRRFDYQVAINTVYTPRSEQGETGITFAELRALADPVQGGLDLLRLAIETRKDQMAAQRWAIKGRDGKDGGDLARAAELALRRPDGVHTWAQWARMLVEDELVTDAAALYLRPGAPGYPKGWRVPEIMDGATLKIVIDDTGRTPLPPEPAYQQNLKGLPAVDYTLDEVIYAPRNLRSHRLYGMGPVEQVVMTVQIALRRQLSQFEYYTAGSVPDMVFGVPDTWTSDQIKAFQAWWDSILSGNTEERRRARFVPGGVKPVALKPDQLKDLFDEWLARIICYAFNLSPQALVKETNRATAETSKEAAQEEGLEPLKLWLKDVLDDVLARAFNAPDLEFAWVDEEIVDPVAKAEVMATALGKGGGKCWLTVDEVRAKYGEPPLTPEQRAELEPPAPPPMLPPGPGDQPPDPAQEKLGKRRRSLRRAYP